MCTSPMWRIDVEKGGKIIPALIRKRSRNKGVIIKREEYNDLIFKDSRLKEFISQIPCGKCVECRLEYSRQWANRCMLEAKYYDRNSFVTLTYDDDHLHFNHYLNHATGEISIAPELRKADLQNFMKSLRERFARVHNMHDIRFFGCGEYGDDTRRPHYHVLLFNCGFDDEKDFFSRNGNMVKRSKELEDIWQKGICTVGDVTWDSCAYVSRYVMKKRKGRLNKDYNFAYQDTFGHLLDYHLWQNEFVLMSRRPGIGRRYYEDHKDDIYFTDEIFVPHVDGLQSVKPVKYYDKLFDIEHPYFMEYIKQERRSVMEAKNTAILSQTDLCEAEYLKVRDNAKKAQIRALQRILD